MSIIKKIRTWLGLDQQEETMKQLLDAVKNLKEEKKTAQPTPAVQESQPAAIATVVPESDTAYKELKEQSQALETLNKELQKQVENLQKQLTTAKEDSVRTLFADFKKSQEEDKEKQEKAGRPRIDGKNTNIRIDIDTYNMLVFLSERKVIKRTRYINIAIKDRLMEDIQADPIFGSLYKEFNKPEKIQEDE